MKYFKQLDLPIIDLYSEFQNLLEKNKIKWHTDIFQICINGVPGKEDNVFYGIGSLDLDWLQAYNEIDKIGNTHLVVPKKTEPVCEDDFQVLCTPFKGTAFEDMYNAITEKYKVGRVRLMKLNPHTCLSWHKDYTDRLHYPIKTQDGCIMIIEDEVMHIPKDSWWATNTTFHHTALNGSREDRIHLVVNVEQKYENI